jgi:hypothetical protein
MPEKKRGTIWRAFVTFDGKTEKHARMGVYR